MSISLRNLKMKPKHSFSYFSRRKSIVRSSASKKRFSASHFLPQILPRDYFSALGLGLTPLPSSRKITLGNIFGEKNGWAENRFFSTLGTK